MKMKTLVIAMALALLIVPSAVNAASVSISGLQPTYLPDESFTIDFLVGDIAGLENLDTFNVGVGINPEANAQISGFSDPSSDSNYVFFGSSFSFQIIPNLPFQLEPSDTWQDRDILNNIVAPYRPSNVAGKLLFSLTYDLTGASPGEVYDFSLYNAFFLDFPDSNYDPGLGDYVSFDQTTVVPTLDQAYSFQVVPIPGAVWLLGAGLMGLFGLRRKSN